MSAFTRYHDVPRSPHNIAKLGAARWELEGTRKTMATERRRVVAQRPSPPTSNRRVALSDSELARLRVLGTGLSQ